ncbi:MAG: hypothetical protein JWM27_3417 [Gemmatimonadetes bacterium]|nr:hypothetical protein [Gemmatimonadota bacterium]
MTTTDVHAAWARLGGGLSVPPAARRVDLEDLIVRTLGKARDDARLFWVAAGWLAVHHNLLNARRLAGMLRGRPDVEIAVAGALFSVARQAAGTATSLASVIKHCRPTQPLRPLFSVVESNPVLTHKAKAGTLPIFARWGFWQDDVSLRLDAVRPVRGVLARCPELRLRALLGATLEAEIVGFLAVLPASVDDLSTILDVTYAAGHAAAGQLVARGFLTRTKEGRRQVLALRPAWKEWLEAAPFAAPAPKAAAVG